MRSVRHAGFIIGCALAMTPVLCAAQDTGSGSAATGTGETLVTDSGSVLMERLNALAEGGAAVDTLVPSENLAASWAAEVRRYRERSTEHRSRCHEELRRSNRDTIAGKSALCIRGDLLLEIGHRRKQRDILAETPGITLDPAAPIDAWIDAANAVVDGVDAGVFTTVDMLKEAKRNLHATYRRPMLLAITHARTSYVRSAIASVAHAARDAGRQLEEPLSFLEDVVPCLEASHAERAAASAATTHAEASAGLTASAEALRRCVGIVRSLVDR